MISKSPKLKLAMEALFASVKVMGNILLISCFFFFVYGIIGVQVSLTRAIRTVRNPTTPQPALSSPGLDLL